MDEELEEDDYVLNIKTVKYVDASDVFSGCNLAWYFFCDYLIFTSVEAEKTMIVSSKIKKLFDYELKSTSDTSLKIDMLKVLDKLNVIGDDVLINLDQQ